MGEELTVSETVEKITSFIGQQEQHFVELNKNGLNQLDFAKECEFAKQVLMKNDYTLSVARGNPDSLQAAISNVAAIGITLNPALSFAYLVPRKVNKRKAICLDISYRGLIKLATDTGIIKAMKAELVYENDTFNYKGFHAVPEFSANPFGDRGELVGVYAMALLQDGTVLVETMSRLEVDLIRDDSEAYKSALEEGENSWQYKNNVWVKYYTEMVKKTVIKRAYKTLPTSEGMKILGQAVDVINEHEGIKFKNEASLFYTQEEKDEYERCIEEEDYFNLATLIRSLSAEAQLQLRDHCIPKAPRGQKGKQTEVFKKNLEEASLLLESQVANVRQLLDEGQDDGIQEILSECSPWTTRHIESQLTNEQQIQLNRLGES